MRECKYKRKKESNKLMMIKIFIYMIIFCDIYKKEMHVHTSNTPTPPPNKSILEKKDMLISVQSRNQNRTCFDNDIHYTISTY